MRVTHDGRSAPPVVRDSHSELASARLKNAKKKKKKKKKKRSLLQAKVTLLKTWKKTMLQFWENYLKQNAQISRPFFSG